MLNIAIADDSARWLGLAKKWVEDDLKSNAKIDFFNNIETLQATIEDQKDTSKPPLLVLLDLDWHGDKKDALAIAKKAKSSNQIKVVFFSSSTDPDDFKLAKDANADGFFTKGRSGTKTQLLSLIELWLVQYRVPFWITN